MLNCSCSVVYSFEFNSKGILVRGEAVNERIVFFVVFERKKYKLIIWNQIQQSIVNVCDFRHVFIILLDQHCDFNVI